MATTTSNTRCDFYVYALFRDDGRIFYIGKGRGDRWTHHERQARNGGHSHKFHIIREVQARGAEVIKIKIHDNLTEATAHEYEVALIASIGRGKAGPLVNQTDGGEGISGFKFAPGKKLSPEQIAKRSATRRGRKLSPESRANIGAGARGRQKSLEECAGIAARKLGTKHPPETLAKMSAAKIGKPWPAARREAQDRRLAAKALLLKV